MIDEADVFEMTVKQYKELVTRKIKGLASEEEVATIEKYKVQVHYKSKVDGKFVKEFNKKNRAIHNGAKMDKLPLAVRRKVHSNL